MRGIRLVLLSVVAAGSWGCVEERDASLGERGRHQEAVADTSTAAVSDVQFTVSESGARLSRTSVPAGTVSLQIQNAGRQPVTVQVSGTGQSWSSTAVAPGERVLLSMVLGAGAYQITTNVPAARAVQLQVQ